MTLRASSRTFLEGSRKVAPAPAAADASCNPSPESCSSAETCGLRRSAEQTCVLRRSDVQPRPSSPMVTACLSRTASLPVMRHGGDAVAAREETKTLKRVRSMDLVMPRRFHSGALESDFLWVGLRLTV